MKKVCIALAGTVGLCTLLLGFQPTVASASAPLSPSFVATAAENDMLDPIAEAALAAALQAVEDGRWDSSRLKEIENARQDLLGQQMVWAEILMAPAIDQSMLAAEIGWINLSRQIILDSIAVTR